MILISKIMIFFTCLTGSYENQNPAEREIRSSMDAQVTCWNKGDLDCFMQAYWHSDSLKFIGSGGLNYGWQKALDNYRKKYPDLSAMGKLKFELISFEPLEDDHYFVVGKFFLTREIGDIDGYFTLLWKKINGQWLIIADHTS